MQIQLLSTLTPSQITDVLSLMRELSPETRLTAQNIQEAVSTAGTRFFAATDDAGHIVGCASLCVFCSPTGRKASVEDVVVSQSARGQGLGRRLMEHLLEYACRELTDVDLHLTSRPHRVAANELYRSLGFKLRETNTYRLKIRGGKLEKE